MKTLHTMNKHLLGGAIATVCISFSTPLLAWEGGYSEHDLNKYIYQGTDKYIRDKHEVDSKVRIHKDINFTKNIHVDGTVNRHDLGSAAVALVHDEQEGIDNKVVNGTVTNETTVSENVGTGAKGNISINTASGGNNIQANGVSIASIDAGKMWGIADSESFLDQASYKNQTFNTKVTNYASVSGGFKNASGNLALNAAAGNGNLQKNDLAISESNAALSESTARMRQDNWQNHICNDSVTNTASLSGDTLSGALGNAGINIAAGTGNIQANSLNIAAGTGGMSMPCPSCGMD